MIDEAVKTSAGKSGGITFPATQRAIGDRILNTERKMSAIAVTCHGESGPG